MISSPCRNCEKKDQSKDECVTTCRQLEQIRRIQFHNRDINISHAIDYAGDNRFLVGHVDYRPTA